MKRLLLSVAAVVLAVTIVVSVVVGIAFKSSIDGANAQSAARLHKAQVNGCARTNARQIVTNRNELATFRLNTLFAQAVTATPPRSQSKAERKLTADFRSRLQDAVTSETWTPINQHCVKTPTAVLLPVAFSDRLPSRADLPPPPRIASK